MVTHKKATVFLTLRNRAVLGMRIKSIQKLLPVGQSIQIGALRPGGVRVILSPRHGIAVGIEELAYLDYERGTILHRDVLPPPIRRISELVLNFVQHDYRRRSI